MYTSVSRTAHGIYRVSKLPGVSVARGFFMNRQNSSISAMRSTETRTASASVATPNARLARRTARASTKNDLRVSTAALDIHPLSAYRHPLLSKQAYVATSRASCAVLDDRHKAS